MVDTCYYFTNSCDGIASRLTTYAYIINKNNNKCIKINVCWDTGASNTCITSDVVKFLELKSCGKTNNIGAIGSEKANVYKATIGLPNNITLHEHYVIEADGLKQQGIDALIGMDIISKGDFAVSNFNGKTTFTFRYPSIGKIDFGENN